MDVVTELAEVPGTGVEATRNSKKFRVLWQGRMELTDVVPGK